MNRVLIAAPPTLDLYGLRSCASPKYISPRWRGLRTAHATLEPLDRELAGQAVIRAGGGYKLTEHQLCGPPRMPLPT